MPQSSHTIKHQLAYTLFPIWAGAVLMLFVVVTIARISAVQGVEDQRMKVQLQQTFEVIRGDIEDLNLFVSDWGVWDNTYQFIFKPNRAYIEANLTGASWPMRKFKLNHFSYLDLQGKALWDNIQPPKVEGEIAVNQLRGFIDDLNQQLLAESRQKGMAHMAGVRASPWGPFIFALQPVSDSAGTAKPNGFLLVIRWLDQRYMADLVARTGHPMRLSQPNPSYDLPSFTPLDGHASYRVVRPEWLRLRGEGLLRDQAEVPMLILSMDEERDILLGVMAGFIGMLLGMLAISLGCGFIAHRCLSAIVLRPVNQLVTALQQFSVQPDVSALPIIDSSREMAMLSHKFREMAAKISLQHRAMQAHSSRMEMAAYTDPLTLLFNRRYLDEWLLARYELTEPRVLVLVDLDHFKRINDQFGHDIGDLILRQLADLLRLVVDEKEPVVRLGGEEFLLLLSQQDAVARIERLRRDIAEFSFGVQTPISMTASLGYCSFPLYQDWEHSSWDLSFKLADMALYQAKQGGRNQWQGYSGQLTEEQWALSPEQIIADRILTNQSSAREGAN